MSLREPRTEVTAATEEARKPAGKANPETKEETGSMKPRAARDIENGKIRGGACRVMLASSREARC